MSAARVFLTSLVPLRLRHWANRPQALGALITISSRNEGDDEDHFTSYSLFMDGSYFGQINNLQANVSSVCQWARTAARNSARAVRKPVGLRCEAFF
jgi:hypothetical protein